MALRSWSWTRIDGRNVFAVPTRDEIRLYDSDDFILLTRLAPSGHRAPIAFVRWSAFHGKLASLSASQVMVHAPQRDPEARGRVSFTAICDFRLDDAHVSIRGLAFSRCADELLFCGRNVGLGKLDVRAHAVELHRYTTERPIIWETREEACDVAKFSPSAFVFASLKVKHKSVQVWRMARHALEAGKQGDQRQEVARVERLAHPDPVVYFSWKPATTQWHSAHESDGTRKAQWFESARILLTCTATRTIRIWTESTGASTGQPCFSPVLVFEPPHPIDNYRWVLSKNRNISDENFQVVDESKDTHTDWISGVDRQGILRLWRVVGIVSSTPSVEETSLRIQVNGEDERFLRRSSSNSVLDEIVQLGEVCVMAYFSQNYFGMPSKFDIVLQRADSIVLSLDITVGEGEQSSQIRKKSWYRSHLGSISALSAHPSLPLIASVDAHPTESGDAWKNEILVFWISFSAFSAESRLIPSGVLTCAEECGQVLCVQWVPTLHFDATPLLLVAFESGVINVYGRCADAVGVVSSPKMRLPPRHRKVSRSLSLAPWTFYDYATGESGVEYEVAPVKPTEAELGLQLEGKGGKLLVSRISSSNEAVRQVAEGDELVGINNKSVVGKDPSEVLALIDVLPPEETILMRFRAATMSSRQESMESQGMDGSKDSTCAAPNEASPRSPTSAPFLSKFSDDSNEKASMEESEQKVEEQASKLWRGFQSALEEDQSPRDSDNVVHAGAVSTYGGWEQLLHVEAAAGLSLLCVCPAYADDGEYIPDAVVVFGITSLPGKLSVWKGVRNGMSRSFELVPIQIRDPGMERKRDITSIAGERDYRQRAFITKRIEGHGGLNSLLFIGDAAGGVEHWRCQVSGDGIQFTMMSSYQIQGSASPPSPLHQQTSEFPNSFRRRGYVSAGQVEEVGMGARGDEYEGGIRHIEVDDPNRVAVLHADRPEELHVFEAESGLGILRSEEFIPSRGRGNILGFCWCSSHVEFNVDALAVQYVSGMVIYQYDMNLHRWTQIGDDIVSPLSIFDCTRDSSALLIGGGHLKVANAAYPSRHSFAVSNEMPVVIGKWDEPGSLLQYSMDWKAVESPQKLPVWHPYVIVTTIFGMHARVGEKDTSLAGDNVSYKFSRAFKDAIQMLKLFAKVIEDDSSTRASASNGILSYTATGSMRAEAEGDTDFASAGASDSIGRYSTAVHRSEQIDKAENLFAMPELNGRRSSHRSRDYETDREVSGTAAGALQKLAPSEAATIQTAIDTLLLGKEHPLKANALILFTSFSEEHLVEMKAILSFVDAIQSLGFELDASGADLGAKRFFSMYLFARALKSVMIAHPISSSDCTNQPEDGNPDPLSDRTTEDSSSDSDGEGVPWRPSLEETPSSGLVWALHSDAQQFLWEHCIQPQMLWDDIRPLWLGLWIKDVKDLRGIVERFAKLSYMRTKDAMDVCLFYVALGKQKVLSALAKLSQNDRNKTLALFLENDFSTERWCYAAAKNAYSLLSKKRYEEAAAFFLLCEPPRIQEAVRVLAVRLGDPSLALVIARLVEYRTSDSFQQEFINTATQAEITPAGDVTRQLLVQDVIPLFRRKHEKWLESCALWWLEDFEQACAVLLPQSQEVDIYEGKGGNLLEGMDLVSCATRATHFYINLTSVTVYFQFLHSSVNSPLLHWAMKKMQQQAFPGIPVSPLAVSASRRRHQLASTADIEHAFSFAAYVCKRSGLSDTALVEMLQARHLVNIHARFEISTMESSTDTSNRLLEEEEDDAFAKGPTSPRFRQRIRRGSDLSCITGASGSPDRAAWRSSPRRLSFAEESISFPNLDQLVTGKKTPLRRATTVNWSRTLKPEKLLPSAPWLKAQIADIECRRWASSAFVGKMIGLRVAREMISHFRAELDLWFRCGDDSDAARSPKKRPRHAKLHREFLEKLCTPLCEQFQMDRKYLYEAALAVMHPHAYLHIVEVCFLLSELERASTLRKWIQYVSLSMLHSCSTFASCSIAEDVYRDWEGLTIQLCYILNLDAQGQVKIPPQVIAQINVAVRTGSIFLGWAKHRSDLVREAVTLPFYTYGGNEDASTKKPVGGLSSFAWEKNLDLIRKLQQGVAANASAARNNRTFEGSLGYTFLGTVASHLLDDDSISLLSWGGMHQATNHHQFKIRKMYTLILMVSVLRTLYARAKLFLNTFKEGSVDAEDEGKEDISSSLFTPQKLWKALGEGPLEGIRRWYALIESHLRCEFDYSVKEVQCLCGLYGLDHAVFEEAAAANSAHKLLDNQERAQVNGNVGSNGGLESEEVVGRQLEGGDIDDEPLNADIAPAVIEEHVDEIPEALAAFLQEIGMSWTLHLALVATSDDYILLLMQHARFGVRTTFRRFRMDPRVYVKSFVLREAFNWFAQHQIFSRGSSNCVVEAHAFLTRCCKQRKLRLLVAHRGEDAQMFPLDHPHTPSSQSNATEDCTPASSELRTDQTNRSENEQCEPMSEATYQQSMMFVDPWEIEAEWNVRRYMHNMEATLHVELGWDRLSPICLETCDGIIESVFKDPDLVAMWKTTGGEGWLVTAITQYQLDSMYSYRTHHQHTRLGLGEKEEPKIPFLVEIHSRSQRNAMFQEAGLPHRFVGVVTVELVEAKDLIACSWVGHWSDAYVFLQLSHPGDEPPSTAEEWSLQTYRSCVGEGGVNPRWSAAENKFAFRFAIPTHCSHVVSPMRGSSSRGGGDAMAGRKSTMIWEANVIDSNRSSVEALETLLPSVFSGPPTVLRCAVYQKNKVLSHQFMGSGKVSLHALTSGSPMDCWLPLEDTPSGSLHVRVALSFQLMCSSMAGQQELEDLQ